MSPADWAVAWRPEGGEMVAESYVNGVSTRKVAAITKELIEIVSGAQALGE